MFLVVLMLSKKKIYFYSQSLIMFLTTLMVCSYKKTCRSRSAIL